MKVRPCHSSAGAHIANYLASFDALAFANLEALQVRVAGVQPTTVINDNESSIAARELGLHNNAWACGVYMSAALCNEVEALVHSAPLSPLALVANGVRAQAKLRTELPWNRRNG